VPSNLLVLDTSTPRAIVALRLADGRLLVGGAEAAARHASGLLPVVRDLLAGAACPPRAIGAIGVGLGPGSFTGLRVGLAAAQGLAYALRVPLVGLDSFEAMARAAHDGARTAVVADAGRGEVYRAWFARGEPGAPPTRSGPTRIVSARRAAEELTPRDGLVGPAAARFRHGVAPTHPDAEILAGMLAEALAAGRADDPFGLEPIYIRRSAAEEKADAVARG
jgi:tRNA threonylcarbamoyladenosine biosynthesis protein TsaB